MYIKSKSVMYKNLTLEPGCGAQIDSPPPKKTTTYNVIIHCFNVLYTNFQGCRTIFNFCV